MSQSGFLDQGVEVVGQTQPGDVQTIIRFPEVTVLGTASFPKTKEPAPLDLADNTIDAQWIQIEGTVRQAMRSANHVSIDFASARAAVGFRRMAYLDVFSAGLPHSASDKSDHPHLPFWQASDHRGEFPREFTHSICPECSKTLYQELYQDSPQDEPLEP